jgi:DNA polymerase-1
MINIHRWLLKEKLRTRMILQVHDELVFDLHKEEEAIVKPRVIELMKTAVLMDVPMEVEVGIGKNWLEAH